MQIKRFLLSSSLVLATLMVSGCAWPNIGFQKPEPIVVNNPVTTFKQQAEDLGNTIELESQLNDLFAEQTALTAENFTYPIADYKTARTKKTFGLYIAPGSGDRFSGYHTGDDVEVADITVEVPVYVLTDATITQKQTVSGYGGVVIVEFTANNQIYHALYGHLDLTSVTASVGDELKQGDQIGLLGADKSTETDGERKHLHFGIYPYTGTELYAGYVQDDADLENWVNPADFLRERNANDAAAWPFVRHPVS